MATIPNENLFDNSRPFDVHKWSDYLEVNRAVDHIFGVILNLGVIKRIEPAKLKKYIKVLSLDLYVCWVSDPTRYIGYSRNHNAYPNDRYNALFIKPDLLVKLIDLFVNLGYVDHKMGVHYADFKRQSRMRATETFIELIQGAYAVKPMMINDYEGKETIILKNMQKKKILYEDTQELVKMRGNLEIINGLLDKTLINLYMPEKSIRRLNHRLITGDTDSDIEHEEPRGALDFNRRRLYRVFNNGSFDMGGRFFGGWWQGIPREARKNIKINHMVTVESDFSGLHINLLYAKKGMKMPYDDPYALEGMPASSRDFLKHSLLTLINATDRKSAYKAIKYELLGRPKRKTTSDSPRKKAKLVLPAGIKNIEELLLPFEDKHEDIREFFYSGAGVYLQNLDAIIAERIMLLLAKKGIPALPLHDSFIVSFPQEQALKLSMEQAYREITGYQPKIDNKTSITMENKKRPVQDLMTEQTWKNPDLQLSEEFKQTYRSYSRINQEWKELTGKDNIFFYSRNKTYNRETYPD
jgi:hypothetical protein